MPSIIAISTSVPKYFTNKERFVEFYSDAVKPADPISFAHKLGFLARKTKIDKRYSCIPDFNGGEPELFKDGEYLPAITKRMDVYKEKIIPLAGNAIELLFRDTKLKASDVTHFITVSCTGLTAPGIEFELAQRFDLLHTEKFGLYFLGCYAAMKALKQANYIARADPKACVLIVCAELCSLHFNPSEQDQDIIANLLFADGASAAFVCGDESEHVKNKIVLKIDQIGSSYIPDTSGLMTWDIGASNFIMYLNKHIASKIRECILPIVNDFLSESIGSIDYWAVHPGGVKIVEAVQDKLDLEESMIEDSMEVLKNFGNMSSPTILFILNNIFNRIKNEKSPLSKSIFSCAFGPGINIEMIRFSSVNSSPAIKINSQLKEHELKV